MRPTLPLVVLAALLFAYALFVLWVAMGLVGVLVVAVVLCRALSFAERKGRAERARVAIEIERRARIACVLRR